MRYIIIFTILLLASCHASKPGGVPVVVTNTDSIHTEYIETVRIDTVIVTVEVPAQSAMQVVTDSTSHLETDYAESDAWINSNGALGHSLRNKNQVKQVGVAVPVKTTEVATTATSIREVPVPYPEPVYVEKPLSQWQKFRLSAFWYLAAACLLLLTLIFRKIVF